MKKHHKITDDSETGALNSTVPMPTEVADTVLQEPAYFILKEEDVDFD